MKKDKNVGKINFIYFRYVFGILLAFLMLAGMLIPCLEYTVGSQHNEPMSALTLVKNSWETSRTYLFDGASNKVSEQTAFSKALLTYVIVLSVLFVIGFAASVYAAFCAFAYFKDKKRTDSNRIFFLTLMPNRAVVCVYQALLLPLAFFPRLIVSLYENILTYQTVLRFSPFEPWLIALVLYVAFVAVVIVSSRFEKALSLDPHYNEVKEKLRRRKKSVMTYSEEQDDARDDQVMPTVDDVLRAEQAERIRKLFSDNGQDK